jgi:hypothetical protein
MISGAKTPVIWLLLADSDRLPSSEPSQDRPFANGEVDESPLDGKPIRAFQKSGNNIPDGKPQARPGHYIGAISQPRKTRFSASSSSANVRIPVT